MVIVESPPFRHETNEIELKRDHWPEKVDVIGVEVSKVNYDEAVKAIISAANDCDFGVVSCHAVHAIVTMSCDEQLRKMANSFLMITPDGQPVRWAMNILHRTGLSQRVYGPQLTLLLCEAAAREGMPIYLYGGNEQVSEDLCANLKSKFPDLVIAGAEAPPFRPLTEEEDAEVVKRINDSGAKLVFIGLGCPKQDIFAHEHADRINAIQICVGAAFDFHAGNKPMAPQWMQKYGLEWVYRLCKEPGRLWKRYLITNSLFVWKVFKSLVLRRKKQSGSTST